MFHVRDLPDDRSRWDAVFAAALGSPDPYGRQLDGMGGGISSLSKVAVIGPATVVGADVDYTFGQVAIDRVATSYKGNCGNISSAVGPFAVEEGLVTARGETATVRIHNTNTGKIIRADFALSDGRPVTDGDLAISGVAGTGAPIRLAFLDPGGATTGRLLPTGAANDRLDIGGEIIDVSLVDAANPVVFVAAASLRMTGREAPGAIGGDASLMDRLERLRVAAAIRMGVVADAREATTTITNLPLVAIVSSASDGDAADVVVRMISAGQPHKATPLTGALCMAVAVAVPDTIPARLARTPSAPLRIAHPGGVLTVDAIIDGGIAREAVVYRTARRLMQGQVLVPERVFVA